jgi:2-keto-4-pentenoate hydratase/2-oxohepta-3-ene-1,7-dioic acid hydratase in catechol pathway
MRLVSIMRHDRRLAGLLDEERILVSELDGGIDAMIATGVRVDDLVGTWQDAASVELDAVLRPPVVLCAGQNYRDHLDEKAPVELTVPEFFLKAGQTIARPQDPCWLDEAVTRKLDYETELGVVIGRAGRHISADDAFQHICGYVVLNDLTARDRQVVQSSDGSFSMALGPGKNFDGSTRVGQWLTPAEEVGGHDQLRLTTRVGKELRQDNTTAKMIFSVADVIAYLSTFVTLLPGTIIATGTPGGTGWGSDPELGGTAVTPPGCAPGRYLRAGDRVTSSIENVGELTFEVAATDPARNLNDQALTGVTFVEPTGCQFRDSVSR